MRRKLEADLLSDRVRFKLYAEDIKERKETFENSSLLEVSYNCFLISNKHVNYT
jgi:hypothetical protein